MKKITRLQWMIINGISVLLFGYIIGSFIFISFNVADWSEGGRVVISLLSTIVSAICIGITYDCNISNNNNRY